MMVTNDEKSEMRSTWYIDSGASSHMCNDRNLFVSYRRVTPRFVVVANSEKLQILGVGDVHTNIEVDGISKIAKIRNVNYTPEMNANLNSVTKLTQEGVRVEFRGNECHMKCGKIPFAMATLEMEFTN